MVPQPNLLNGRIQNLQTLENSVRPQLVQNVLRFDDLRVIGFTPNAKRSFKNQFKQRLTTTLESLWS